MNEETIVWLIKNTTGHPFFNGCDFVGVEIPLTINGEPSQFIIDGDGTVSFPWANQLTQTEKLGKLIAVLYGSDTHEAVIMRITSMVGHYSWGLHSLKTPL